MSIPVQEIRDGDFRKFRELPPPVQRAAYSDRTAWLMAVMSQLAYLDFDIGDEGALIEAARQLTAATGDRFDGENAKSLMLESIRRIDENSRQRQRSGGVSILESTLAAGKFDLAGAFVRSGTEGFLAFRHDREGLPNMAVLTFRGTTSRRDWLTNIQTDLKKVARENELDWRADLGGLHKGFVAAFLLVEHQIRCLLASKILPFGETPPDKDAPPPEPIAGYEWERRDNCWLAIPDQAPDTYTPRGEREDGLLEVRDLPLYICGHSLGGALAVVATWALESRYNAACYTYGAPRVGNSEFAERFKTPIYRVVNGADPVPFIPPSNRFIQPLKLVLRWLPLRLDWAVKFLIKRQGYRHFGDMRYLHRTRSEIIPEIGPVERLVRSLGELSRIKGLLEFHEISRYRDKLRDIALRRNSGRRDLSDPVEDEDS